MDSGNHEGVLEPNPLDTEDCTVEDLQMDRLGMGCKRKKSQGPTRKTKLPFLKQGRLQRRSVEGDHQESGFGLGSTRPPLGTPPPAMSSWKMHFT